MNFMKVLVIDVGGTHIKVASTDTPVPIKIVSGPDMTAKTMADQVLAATKDWQYDAVTIGYPGPVAHDHPLLEPHNLAPGWTDFDYKGAFANKPLRFINDAAMQALGGYKGGRMLFLGTGTGLGSAMIFDGIVVPPGASPSPLPQGQNLRGIHRSCWSRTTRPQTLGEISPQDRRPPSRRPGLRLRPPRRRQRQAHQDPSKCVILGANSNAIAGGLALWKDGNSTTPTKVPIEKADES